MSDCNREAKKNEMNNERNMVKKKGQRSKEEREGGSKERRVRYIHGVRRNEG